MCRATRILNIGYEDFARSRGRTRNQRFFCQFVNASKLGGRVTKT